MTADRIAMVTVDYPDGNRIAVRVPPPTTNPTAKALVDAFLADLTPAEQELLILILVEDIHEDAIYRKVCERKGLLPL